MRNKLLAIILSLGITLGCNERKTEYSPNMEASGFVKERTYTPSSTDTDISLDYEGNPSISFSTTPEKYRTVFGWELGDFVCEGYSGEVFYKRFKDNQRARLTFRKRTDSELSKDGREVRRSEWFELMDAWPDNQ